MRIVTKLISLFLAVCVSACGLCLLAAADDEAIDPERLCSLSVVMRYKETTIGGGNLTLFRVGELDIGDGTLHYVLTGQFAGSGAELADPDDASLAQLLADYAAQRNLNGDTRDIGDDGIAHYDGMAVGIYLVVQRSSAEGYYPIKPFLISLPAIRDGHYVYDAEAVPKVEADKGDTSDDSSESSESSADSSDDSLAQTGQLQWPIPILFIAGLVFIALGLMVIISLRHRRST